MDTHSPLTPNMPAVINSIPESDEIAQKDKFVTRSGITFKLRPVPPFLIIDSQRRYPEPKPPKALVPDKGDDVYEENIHDPEYVRAMTEWRNSIGEISNAILMTRGTELEASSLPSDIEGPDGTDWAEDVMEFAEIAVPLVGRRRYFCWMKYVALASMDDFTGIIQKISSMGGITMEADVADATAQFPDNTQGNTPEGLPATEGDGRGDTNILTFAGRSS